MLLVGSVLSKMSWPPPGDSTVLGQTALESLLKRAFTCALQADISKDYA